MLSCNANVNERLTHECLKKYLADRNVREEMIDYVDPYYGSISDCESAVKGKLADIYNNLRSSLVSNRNNRALVIDCTMRDIEEGDDVNYELIVLQEQAVEMISNWRFWKYFSKSSKIESLQNKAAEIVRKSLLKCKGHREFGTLFTDILDKTIEWQRSGEQEFCIRKMLVNNSLINPQLYQFRENPKNVRFTETLNCTIIYEGVVNELLEEAEKSNSLSSCVIKVYREKGYADNVLKAEILSKSSLTTNDKTKEKQNFINNMVDISYDTKNC
jgi:hypothetical protein